MTMRLEGEKGQIDALFARGSPYVTFRVDGVPSLKSDALFTDLQAVDAVTNATLPQACAAYPSCILASMKGDCCPQPSGIKHPCCSGSLGAQTGEVFSVSLSNGQAWRLYFSTPVTLTWDSTGAHTTHKFAGVMRAAVVPSNATKDALMLDAHAEAYATAGSVRVTVDRAKDPDVGLVAFDWQVAYLGSSIPRDELEPTLLMLALPHHVDALVADSSIGFLDILRYRGGLKGMCRAVLGSSWTIAEPLTKIGFTAPRPLKEQKHVDAIKKQVKSDVMRPAGETDKDAAWICFDDWFGNAYWNGKEAARLAGLALVAQEVGDDASFTSAINQMRSILELWLEARNGDPLVYDATYGGIVTEKGLYDHDADFGNGYYNDHHFHYGYLLHAAAVAVKNDAGFAAKHRRALFALLYDVASPGSGHSLDSVSIDPRAFPRARHKDFYAGHSWASGIFFMGQGKAQESSSEAANAYYGAYLLALSLGDVALADWCRTLLAMEVRAARYYYHMPVGGEVYPARFADHNRMVGVLGALSTGAQTWFGPSPIYAHGIQILPVTPATEDLLKPPSFIAEDLAFLDVVLEHDAAVDDSWSSLVVCERAVLDPERAWKEMMALQTVDGGASKASLLYWIATRPPPDAETKALLAKARTEAEAPGG